MADMDVSFYPKANPNMLLDTASGFIDLANKAVANRAGLATAEQAERNLALHKFKVLSGAMGAIAAKPDASYQDFAGLQTLVDNGIIDQDFFNNELKTIPPNATPEQVRAKANAYNSRLLTAPEIYAAQTGYSLGSAAGKVETPTGPYGAPEFQTQAGFAAAHGAGRDPYLAQPAPPPNDLTRDPNAPPASGNFFMPDAPPAQRYGGDGAGYGAGTAPAKPGSTFGPAPADVKRWEASTAQFQKAQENSANWTARKYPYERMIDLLPTTPSGTISDVLSIIPDAAATIGIDFFGDEAAKLAEMRKHAATIANQSGFAGQSMDHLAASIAANPSSTMNNSAAQTVVKSAYAIERASQAAFEAAAAAGVPPQEFSSFAAKWGADQDLRAYAMDLMDPKAFAALRADIEKDRAAAATDRAAALRYNRFMTSLANAEPMLDRWGK